MDKIEELKKSLEEQKSIIKDMEAQLQAIKAEQAQDEEWPKNGDSYLSAPVLGCAPVIVAVWCDDASDMMRLSTGNAHRTKEAAEAYRDWLTDPRIQARRMVEMCEGFSPNGIRYIGIDRSSNRIFNTDWSNMYGGLSFSSKSQAQAAIDKLGEPLIKVALGGITGDEAREIVMKAMRMGV